MENQFLLDCYYLRLFKTANKSDFRVSRNSPLRLKLTSARKIKSLHECDEIYLIANLSMSSFALVGYKRLPYFHVDCHFDVLSNVDERLKFMLRVNTYKHDTSGFNMIPKQNLVALDNYLSGSNKTLFF